MITDANLNFWIKNNCNVLFRGKHGCGKTSSIIDAFKSNNIKYQYFSAATMDPWVDFIGVPKEKIDENGNSYLDLIRPKHFQNDEVEAIFLDEFNRSTKKVRNAVMELIQFKSINGKKFNNLKMVWAAINPDDDSDNKYDVDALDPAQMDRFHVITDVPYTPSASYFREKYGKDNADIAISWWKDLSKDQKDCVSPRRLDYTLDMYNKGGDIKYVLPHNVNASKLLIELASGSFSKKLDNFIANNLADEAKTFLNIENNYYSCINNILKKKNYINFFLPLIQDEKLISLMSKEKVVKDFVFNNYLIYKDIIVNIAKAKSSKLAKDANMLVKKYSLNGVVPVTVATKNSVLTDVSSFTLNANPNLYLSSGTDVEASYAQYLKECPKYLAQFNINNKLKLYRFYENYLPSPSHMTEEFASIAINDLTNIVKSSHKYTLGSMSHLSGMINTLIKTFMSKKDGKIPLSKPDLIALKKKIPHFIFNSF